MSTPSRAQILGLYRKYLATAQSFSSYNFRTYFLRRSRDMFRSSLLPASEAASSSPFSKAGSRTAPVSPATLTSSTPSILTSNSSTPNASAPLSADPSSGSTNPHSGTSADAEKLRAFYATAVKDLEVLRRAALMNRMYEGEKLVVEAPRLIIGGGGAGAEASTGGAGQPVGTEQSKGGAPPSD